ncbi:MAG: FG-GAP-like repeat-containing protein [bacterium]|nr:FG-GAP-like repeat-containing protein [bacterium]
MLSTFLLQILISGLDLFVGCHCWINTGDTSNLWSRKQVWDIPYTSSPQYIHASFCNLDSDSDYDAYVTGDINTIIAFENIGSDTVPAWQKKPEWDFSPPGFTKVFWAEFVDIDADGKYELSIAKIDTIKFFKNIGTGDTIKWERHPAWDLPIPDENLAHTYGDLDNDGDLDVMVRRWWACEIEAFENIGTKNNPVWQKKTAWGRPPYQSQCALGDLDGNKTLDLICHGGASWDSAYENTGTITNPVWTKRMNWLTGDTSATNGLYPEFINISSPSAGIQEKIISHTTALSISKNPFSKSTVITYFNSSSVIPAKAGIHFVSLNLYDLTGRLIKTLANGEKPAGSYSTTLSANELKTGIYFVKLTSVCHPERSEGSNTISTTKKLVLMK